MGPRRGEPGRRLVRATEGLPRPFRHVPAPAARGAWSGRAHPRSTQQPNEGRLMAQQTSVAYTTRDQAAAEENQRLIDAVFAELALARPDGLTYRVSRSE